MHPGDQIHAMQVPEPKPADKVVDDPELAVMLDLGRAESSRSKEQERKVKEKKEKEKKEKEKEPTFDIVIEMHRPAVWG